jgi:hypothetical protein
LSVLTLRQPSFQQNKFSFPFHIFDQIIKIFRLFRLFLKKIWKMSSKAVCVLKSEKVNGVIHFEQEVSPVDNLCPSLKFINIVYFIFHIEISVL